MKRFSTPTFLSAKQKKRINVPTAITANYAESSLKPGISYRMVLDYGKMKFPQKVMHKLFEGTSTISDYHVIIIIYLILQYFCLLSQIFVFQNYS